MAPVFSIWSTAAFVRVLSARMSQRAGSDAICITRRIAGDSEDEGLPVTCKKVRSRQLTSNRPGL